MIYGFSGTDGLSGKINTYQARCPSANADVAFLRAHLRACGRNRQCIDNVKRHAALLRHYIDCCSARGFGPGDSFSPSTCGAMSGADGLMGLGVDPVIAPPFPSSMMPPGTTTTPEGYQWASVERISTISDMIRGKAIDPNTGAVGVTHGTSAPWVEDWMDEQLKAGKLVCAQFFDNDMGVISVGLYAMAPDDPNRMSLTILHPIYARPQWYHKLGMSQTTGYVVAGVGVLGGLYLLSRVL